VNSPSVTQNTYTTNPFDTLALTGDDPTMPTVTTSQGFITQTTSSQSIIILGFLSAFIPLILFL